MSIYTSPSTTTLARRISDVGLNAASTSTGSRIGNNSFVSHATATANETDSRPLRRRTFEQTPSSSRAPTRLSTRARTMPASVSVTENSAASTSPGDRDRAVPYPTGILSWARCKFTKATTEPTRDSALPAEGSRFEAEFYQFPELDEEFPQAEGSRIEAEITQFSGLDGDSDESCQSSSSSSAASTFKAKQCYQPQKMLPMSEAEAEKWKEVHGIWKPVSQ